MRVVFGILAIVSVETTLAAQQWQRIAASVHPLATIQVAMHHDPVRSRTVCLTREAFEFGERLAMHEWAGDGWLARTVASLPAPGPMTFDAQRQQVVCLNGWSVFAFDGVAWQGLPSAPPVGWWGGVLPTPDTVAYEPLRGVLVAVGEGHAHELHNGVWLRVGAAIGAGGAGCRAAAEPATGRVLAYASDGTLWRWNGAAWQNTMPAATPPPRLYSQLVTDTAGGRVLLVGGQDPGGPSAPLRDDVWTWNGAAWSLLGTMPTPRAHHGAAMSGASLIVFGGNDNPSLAVGIALAPPTTLSGSGAVFTTFGGVAAEALVAHDSARGRTVALLDGVRTHEFDGYRWFDTGVVLPGIARQLGFHGGTARCIALDDLGKTWTWDGVQWLVVAVTGPAPRVGGSMAYDALRDRTVLFGGAVGGVPSSETWLWDGGGWTNAAPAHSPATGWVRMAWDPVSGRVLAAGTTFVGLTPTNVLNAWDGFDWTGALVMPPLAAPRIGIDASGALCMVGIDVSLGDTGDVTMRWDGTSWSPIVGPDGQRATNAELVYDTVRMGIVAHDFTMSRSYLLTPQSAGSTPLGSGCGAGAVPELAVPTRAEIGADLRLELHRGIANGIWLPLASLVTLAVPLSPGCTGYVDQPLVLGTSATSASGFGELVFSLPPAPSLHGVSLYVQGLQLAAGGALFGFADLTGALDLRIGD